MSNSNESSFNNDFLPLISFVLFLMLIGMFCNQPKELNPRDKNGYDVIHFGDSIYHINFKIDSVEYIPNYD